MNEQRKTDEILGSSAEKSMYCPICSYSLYYSRFVAIAAKSSEKQKTIYFHICLRCFEKKSIRDIELAKEEYEKEWDDRLDLIYPIMTDCGKIKNLIIP